MLLRRLARPVAAGFAALSLALVAVSAAEAADPPRYKAYYDIFDRGGTLIPGHDTRWVPQGLTYWPERDALVISYYDGDEALNSRVAVISRSTGARLSLFELPERGHVGGLAMSKTQLWVASSGRVSRIAKSSLSSTADGGRLPVNAVYTLAASSFATFDGTNLWVGKYEDDATKARYVYRYPLSAKEAPSSTYAQRLAIPTSIQGMAVKGSTVLFSRSGGSGIDADSHLETHALSAPSGRAGRSLVAPNQSEGVVIAQGELHVLYESGSAKYSGADYRVKTVHHGPVSKLF
jgi:hypothetical protein